MKIRKKIQPFIVFELHLHFLKPRTVHSNIITRTFSEAGGLWLARENKKIQLVYIYRKKIRFGTRTTETGRYINLMFHESCATRNIIIS